MSKATKILQPKGLSDGASLVGPSGEELKKSDEHIIKTDLNPSDKIVEEVGKKIKNPTVTPVPDRILVIRVTITDLRSSNGMYIPTSYTVAGHRTGQNGETKQFYRYFVVAVGSRVYEQMGLEIKPGDEILHVDSERIQSVDPPYLLDYDNDFEERLFVFHWTEITAVRVHQSLREKFV